MYLCMYVSEKTYMCVCVRVDVNQLVHIRRVKQKLHPENNILSSLCAIIIIVDKLYIHIIYLCMCVFINNILYV